MDFTLGPSPAADFFTIAKAIKVRKIKSESSDERKSFGMFSLLQRLRNKKVDKFSYKR